VQVLVRVLFILAVLSFGYLLKNFCKKQNKKTTTKEEILLS